MKLLVLFLFSFDLSSTNAQVQMNFKFDTPYGNNESVGNLLWYKWCKIYYEEYGKGTVVTDSRKWW
jgi:hypothetical protein